MVGSVNDCYVDMSVNDDHSDELGESVMIHELEKRVKYSWVVVGRNES